MKRRCTPLFASLLVSATATLAAACTVENPNAPDGEDGGMGTEDAGSNGTDTADGDADSAEGGTADADGDSGDGVDEPPTVGVVEVDGSSAPAAIDSSRVVQLRVTADDDRTVEAVEFYDGDVLIGQGTNEAGNLWSLAWPVVGETFDGEHFLTVRAIDDGAQEATSEATSVSVDVPPSGTLVWELPDTELNHFGAVVRPFGEAFESVFAGGSYESGGDPGAFARRASDGAGATWIDTVFTDVDVSDGLFQAASTAPDGLTVAAGGWTRDSNSNTEAFVAWYDDSGNEIERWRPSSLPGAMVQDMGYAADGDLFVVMTTPSGNGRLQRFGPTRQPDGEVLTEAAFAIAISSDAVWVLGRKGNGTPRLERYDHNLVLIDSSETIFGSNDIAVDEDLQRVYIVGNETSSTGRVSAYDWNISPVWSEAIEETATSSEPRRVSVNPIHQLVVGSLVDDAIPLVDWIHILSPEGMTLTALDLNSDQSQPIRQLEDVSVDPAGYVYGTGHILPTGGGPRPHVLFKLHP